MEVTATAAPPCQSSSSTVFLRDWPEYIPRRSGEAIFAISQITSCLPFSRACSFLLSADICEFWRVVSLDGSAIAKMLTSYLQHFSRRTETEYRDMPIFTNFRSSTMKQFHEQMHRRVLLIYVRLTGGIDPEVTESDATLNKTDVLRQQQVFTVPTLLDVCAIYGKDNAALVGSLIRTAFELLPELFDDLESSLDFISKRLKRMQRQVIMLRTALTPKGLSRINNHGELMQEALDYLADASLTLNMFVDSYPECADVLLKLQFEQRLPEAFDELMDVLLSEILLRFNGGFGSDQEAQCVFIEDQFVSLFRALVKARFLDFETPAELAHDSCMAYFKFFKDVARQRRFTKAYNRRFNILQEFERLCPKPDVYHANVAVLEDALNDEPNLAESNPTLILILAAKANSAECRRILNMFGMLDDVYNQPVPNIRFRTCPRFYEPSVEEWTAFRRDGTLPSDLTPLKAVVLMRRLVTETRYSAEYIDEHNDAYFVEPAVQHNFVQKATREDDFPEQRDTRCYRSRWRNKIGCRTWGPWAQNDNTSIDESRNTQFARDFFDEAADATERFDPAKPWLKAIWESPTVDDVQAEPKEKVTGRSSRRKEESDYHKKSMRSGKSARKKHRKRASSSSSNGSDNKEPSNPFRVSCRRQQLSANVNPFEQQEFLDSLFAADFPDEGCAAGLFLDPSSVTVQSESSHAQATNTAKPAVAASSVVQPNPFISGETKPGKYQFDEKWNSGAMRFPNASKNSSTTAIAKCNLEESLPNIAPGACSSSKSSLNCARKELPAKPDELKARVKTDFRSTSASNEGSLVPSRTAQAVEPRDALVSHPVESSAVSRPKNFVSLLNSCLADAISKSTSAVASEPASSSSLAPRKPKEVQNLRRASPEAGLSLDQRKAKENEKPMPDVRSDNAHSSAVGCSKHVDQNADVKTASAAKSSAAHAVDESMPRTFKASLAKKKTPIDSSSKSKKVP